MTLTHSSETTVLKTALSLLSLFDAYIETADQGKNLKYKRKANLNRTINALRNNFWRILLENDTQVRQDLFDQLCQDIARFPEPVRPGRSPKRSSPRNKRFPITKKSVLP